MTGVLRIGNASGFYGDRFSAWREMLDGGELDVLTGDYLAELTMLILGRDLLKDPATGYAKTFLRQLEDTLGTAVERGVKLVTNAGGLNPGGLATAIGRLAQRLGITVHIGQVTGDDLRDRAAELDLGKPLTANAYLGGFGIAACLRGGADVVVTGRVTDASLVVGPGIAAFGWTRADLDALAGATVAGHVLECGAQATGGNFSFFAELPDGGRNPGFPIAELHADGSSVVTKHAGTGGAVTTETVTAQLLYELGATAYAGPDVVAHFDTVTLRQEAPDRVRVGGVRGTPPPGTLKVGTNELGGFRNAMTFVLCGLQIDEKAHLVQEQLQTRLGEAGLEFQLARTDRPDADTEQTASALLTAHIRDADPKRAGRAFSQAAVELALASYPGCTLTSPPGDAAPFGVFRSRFVAQDAVTHEAVLPDGSRVPIDPPAVTAEPTAQAAAESRPPYVVGETKRVPLGLLVGARSGDKGGDANVGVWARTPEGFAWLRDFLTVKRFQDLLPEAATLGVERYELPNLGALNFLVRGILGADVAASTRFDPQGKALGEWLRSRLVDAPVELL